MRKLEKIKTILMFVGIIFALSPIISNNLNNIAFENKNLEISKISGKIFISGNSGWVAFRNDGNCTGSGTYSDPYVIEDLVIDSGGSGSCILIEYSNVYFKIENCTLYNSGQLNSGVKLINVINGQIIDNNCSFNWFGINLELNSENNHIQGNVVNNNLDDGINFYGSSYNYIRENSINYNGRAGINLAIHSNYNEVFNNTINSNEPGIIIGSSKGNVITENIITNNLWCGIYLNEQSSCNKVSNNHFSGNVDDIQDLQGECPRENLLPLNLLLLIIGIILGITSIMVIAGILIIRRRSSRRQVILEEKPLELDILQEEVVMLTPEELIEEDEVLEEEVITPEEIPIEDGILKEEIESAPEEMPIEEEVIKEEELVVEEPIKEEILPEEEVVAEEPIEEEALPEEEVVVEEPIEEEALPEEEVVVEEQIEEEALLEEVVVEELIEETFFFCKFCGIKLDKEASFCPQCGTSIKMN